MSLALALALALAIFDGVQRAEGDLDPLLVVHVDARTHFFDGLPEHFFGISTALKGKQN